LHLLRISKEGDLTQVTKTAPASTKKKETRLLTACMHFKRTTLPGNAKIPQFPVAE